MLRTAFPDNGIEWFRELSCHAVQVALAQFHPFLYHVTLALVNPSKYSLFSSIATGSSDTHCFWPI